MCPNNPAPPLLLFSSFSSFSLLFFPFLLGDGRGPCLPVYRYYRRDVEHSTVIACALLRGAEGRKGDGFGRVFLVGLLFLCAASSLLYTFCRGCVYGIHVTHTLQLEKFDGTKRHMRRAMLRPREPRGNEKGSSFLPSSLFLSVSIPSLFR